MQKSKYDFSELNVVYTPFIGGYWTTSIQFLLSMHLLLYSLQLICYFLIGYDALAYSFAVSRENFALWKFLTGGFIHNLVPLELIASLTIVAFMGGDLDRQWGCVSFLSFYYLVNILSLALRYLAAPSTVYGSMGGALAILYAFAFSHPKRLVYGKFTVKRLATFILFSVLLFAYFFCTPLQIFAYLAGLPVAFTAVQIVPILLRKLSAWKLLQETRSIYRLDAIKEHSDVILDKIFRRGISQLTPEELEYLEKASRILKKHCEKTKE